MWSAHIHSDRVCQNKNAQVSTHAVHQFATPAPQRHDGVVVPFRLHHRRDTSQYSFQRHVINETCFDVGELRTRLLVHSPVSLLRIHARVPCRACMHMHAGNTCGVQTQCACDMRRCARVRRGQNGDVSSGHGQQHRAWLAKRHGHKHVKVRQSALGVWSTWQGRVWSSKASFQGQVCICNNVRTKHYDIVSAP
jgi:hypothetical protein